MNNFFERAKNLFDRGPDPQEGILFILQENSGWMTGGEIAKRAKELKYRRITRSSVHVHLGILIDNQEITSRERETTFVINSETVINKQREYKRTGKGRIFKTSRPIFSGIKQKI